MKGLYRVSVITIVTWGEKKKPVYVVADSKEKAEKYVNTHLKSSHIAGKISFLGVQLGMNMFHSD